MIAVKLRGSSIKHRVRWRGIGILPASLSPSKESLQACSVVCSRCQISKLRLDRYGCGV